MPLSVVPFFKLFNRISSVASSNSFLSEKFDTFSIDPDLTIVELPAQNNVINTNIKYALEFLFIQPLFHA